VLEGREGVRNKPSIIQEEEVNELLGHLDTYKSMGLDGIHPRVLRELVEELAKPLSNIYQKSCPTGEVPDDWRFAIVTPIYKKGQKKDPGNYRPVSLTSVLGKIMYQFILSALTGVSLKVRGKGSLIFNLPARALPRTFTETVSQS